MNELTPNWDDLRLFAAIAAEGSLSAAARRLRLSRPTMGRRLQALEERMGAKPGSDGRRCRSPMS